MENDKEKFKTEFRNRTKSWILNLIKLHDAVNQDVVGKIIFNQLIRSGTSVGANYIEAQASSSKDEINQLANILGSSLLTLKGRKKLKK